MNLTLADNRLIGSIQHILTTLPQIQLFDVSNYNLWGPIPKFPSKTRLITRGNALLGQNIYEQLGRGGQM